MRVSTQQTFSRVLLGLSANQLRSLRAQEQISSGRRILRPSDDPVGTTRALALRRRLTESVRHGEAITAGRNALDNAASGLGDASGLLAEARELLLSGMNGTLAQEDRESIATEFDLLRAQLLEVANLRAGERYVFGGTLSSEPPWVEKTLDGRNRIVYRGNDQEHVVRIGESIDVATSVTGQEIFGKIDPQGTIFSGLSGVANGTTADEGYGYAELTLRHESTDPGALASVGIALAGGGADDTLLGDNTLVIDGVAGTIQLGDGTSVQLPDPSAVGAADFVVKNELGAELHLDFTGYTGADYAGTVRGDGSISLNGTDFTPLTFAETDLELRDDALGAVIHVDTTGIKQAGSELVTFSGTVNVFDLMQGIAEDLRNAEGFEHPDILDRLNQRLVELDRNQDNLLAGIGVLGSRSQRLAGSFERVQNVELQLEGLLSSVQDADLAETALDLARSDLSLQVAQASGARLIQTSLLNFI